VISVVVLFAPAVANVVAQFGGDTVADLPVGRASVAAALVLFLTIGVSLGIGAIGWNTREVRTFAAGYWLTRLCVLLSLVLLSAMALLNPTYFSSQLPWSPDLNVLAVFVAFATSLVFLLTQLGTLYAFLRGGQSAAIHTVMLATLLLSPPAGITLGAILARAWFARTRSDRGD